MLKIGFEAKRFFNNNSGLGTYSRNLISSLVSLSPSNEYFLFSPLIKEKKGLKQIEDNPNIKIIVPKGFINKLLPSRWRSRTLKNYSHKLNLDLYHGLSNEIPFSGNKIKIPKIVTIHDLIFLKYPKFYSAIDRNIYLYKTKYACNHSDLIFATSEQTKMDLVELLKINPSKIKITYQCCNEKFLIKANPFQKNAILEKYKLPANYILTIGTIEKRKNLGVLIESFKNLKWNKELHLVIIGKKTPYFNTITNLIDKYHLNRRIHFYSNIPDEDLPLIYQCAQILVYPSIYEGFGIPIIEALFSSIPVITSNTSSLIEVGGLNTLYFDPNSHEMLTDQISKILFDINLKEKMVTSGYEFAEKNFSPLVTASRVMELYKSLLK